jgi:cytochrome c553
LLFRPDWPAPRNRRRPFFGIFIRRSVKFMLLSAMVCAPSASLLAQEIAGDALRGKIRSKAEQCQECHGDAGISTSDHYPKLAGQWPAYIRKQLGDFQSGARKNEIMTAMAAGLSQQDIADIAAYFSSAPRWTAEEAEPNAIGRRLFEDGDSTRNLPACMTCHGPKGAGAGEIPAIGGQRQLYLLSQLHFWKIEDRQNSPDGLMSSVALALSDSEISAIAQYLASLGADPS